MELNKLSPLPPSSFPTVHTAPPLPFLIWPWTGRTPTASRVCWRATVARQSPQLGPQKTQSDCAANLHAREPLPS